MIDGTLFQIQVPGWIYWRLPINGTTEVTLPPFPGWSLVTPIGMARMGQALEAVARIGDDVLIGTGTLFLWHKAEPVTLQWPMIAQVLSLLRYVSRQSTVPRAISVLSTFDPQPLDEQVTIPATFNEAGSTIVWDYARQNAISEEDLRRLQGLSADFSIPVHVDVLLDALEAHRDEDFRKSLLYAAIAVESFASARLEAAHAQVLTRRAAEHRVLHLQTGQATFVHKDPIYDILSASDNFGRLLHERPLYLEGRSFLIDEPDRYRLALQLYGTRNKIAHRGDAPPEERFFAINKEGSAGGLAAAIAAFRWLGDASPYCIPTAMIYAEDGRSLGRG